MTNISTERRCGVCREAFLAYRNQKYCSGACRSSAFRLRESECDGPLPKDPSLEEIRHMKEMIRSGRLVVGGKSYIQPNWFVKRKKGKA
jgi:hypothetical protein